jgi:hemoglobin
VSCRAAWFGVGEKKMATIYEQTGGFAEVRKIVSAFYDKILDSPNLQNYFEDIDMHGLIDHQTM